MQCKNHPTAKGVDTCNQCGSWLCERCSFERDGRIFCPGCAADNGAESSRHAHSPGSAKYISWGLLFLFSVVIPLPGLNYMYMGLIKRGLMAMSVFFGLIFMVTQLSGGLGRIFAFAIPILILTCIFDGFNLRGRINFGEEVNDTVDDIINSIRNNRRIIISFLILVIAVYIVASVLPLLMPIVPIALIIWAVVTFFSKPKK